MIKLIWLAVLASVAVRLLAGRWPWELWRDSERAGAESRARTLLGVPRKPRGMTSWRLIAAGSRRSIRIVAARRKRSTKPMPHAISCSGGWRSGGDIARAAAASTGRRIMTHRFHPSILREYDIRGVVGQTLGEADARAIGQTFGTRARAEAEAPRIVVGRDGRLSSPALEQALVEGLLSAGVDVVRIGLCPTPMLYFAEATLDGVTGGIQVTGSHNPADQNGFKFVLRGRPFFGEAIAELASMAQAGNHATGTGQVTDAAVIDSYVATLLAALDGIEPAVLGGLRIGWDAGNGAAGPVVDRLVERMPGFHVRLHTAVDGRFPTTIPTRRWKPIWPTCAMPWPRTRCSSAWPSTGTATGSAWSTAWAA
jgi:hypothetical protein